MFSSREFIPEEVKLRHYTDEFLNLVQVVLKRKTSSELSFSFGLLHQSCQNVDECGLPCSVVSQQPYYLVFLYL